MKIRSLVAVLSVLGAFVLALPSVAAEKNAEPQAVGKDVKSQATPSAAVKTFAVALGKADFATAKKCIADKEMVAMIATVEELIKEVPELKQDVIKEFAGIANLKVVSEKITGDTAEVVVLFKEKNKEKRDTMKLKKFGNDWKIVE